MTAQASLPDDFQQQLHHNGQRLLDAARRPGTIPGQQHKWLDLLINRTISEHDFRIQALRFVDVLPTLNDDQQLAEHLQEYFADLQLPRFAEWGLKHTDTPWATRIAAPTVRYTLRGLARKFMGGSQMHHALTTISRLRHQNMNFTLDLLGEATISETESRAYQEDYLHMLDSLSEPVANWNQNEHLDTLNQQAVPRLNLSIKLSSLYSQIRTTAPEASIAAILEKLIPILHRAREVNAAITIDMEQYDFKHIVLSCFKEILSHDDFKDWPFIGIAIQAYLKDSYQDLQSLIELAEKRGTAFTVRLVRGAYWDYETVIARQNNWSCPVWENKNDTDYNYEQCLNLLFSNHAFIHTAVATHNPRSIAFAITLAENLGLSSHEFEFQMLYGMADAYKDAITSLDYRLRVYVPFGETLPGMAYLVRRLLENSSGQSLLDSGFGGSIPEMDDTPFNAPAPTRSSLSLASNCAEVFCNTPILRFTQQSQRDAFEQAIESIKQQPASEYPLIINGREYMTPETITSYNPSHKAQVIGQVASASHKHADLALDAASRAFPQWSELQAQQRADTLRRVAAMLSKQRMHFAALQVLEAGKNWQEADADVCEAIDFLYYYANQAEQIFNQPLRRISGEDNQIIYRPRGTCLVIAPWNFPLAILCGMLSAALVMGNTCIVKPSSLTPVIAAQFIKLWQEADIPPGVINFLPGPGKIVGEYLARKPDIHIISFTGSLQVGTQLINIGSQVQPGQHHLKKVISEMGGKNAIIIDSDADLDDAIIGSLQSAFGFQGQKCSAASRLIVVDNIYEHFVARLLEAAASITIGDPQDPQFFMGPVIDESAYQRIQQIIQHARLTATYHPVEHTELSEDGFYIAPCVFTDVDPESPLAQEEIFGPVLSIIRADNFEHAVNIANNTRYALTGGVYSRQPSHLAYARSHFNVGNIYLNRKTTGAIVGRQPFGGHGMSGLGSKAGGKDYLLQFVDCTNITENTLRRGFAPDADV